MAKASHTRITKYFAAANSYDGFKSHFARIFPSSVFDKIYVLKGGPGTGKSSLMKKISAKMDEKKCQVEKIYCSSDPSSLDGIIIENKGKKIAMIDGTAPHERDAIYPGIVDEIINLAEGIDKKWLMPQRDEIININQEKASAYKVAYHYLKTAGVSDGFIRDSYKKYFDIIRAKSEAERFLSNTECNFEAANTTVIISSFGRLGYHTIDTEKRKFKNRIGVFGDEYATDFFLDFLQSFLKDAICFRSPLFSHSYDGLGFIDSDLIIEKSGEGEINSQEFIVDGRLNSEQIKKALEIKNESLEEAKRWFLVASDLHFRLEDIYNRAMDFSKNDEIYEKKLIEIENILEI